MSERLVRRSHDMTWSWPAPARRAGGFATAVLAAALGIALPVPGRAQPASSQPAPPPPGAPQPAGPTGTGIVGADVSQFTQRVPPDQYAVLRLSNRPIVTFRASVVPRTPAERAASADQRLSALVEDAITGPITSRSIFGGSIVSVAGREVLGLVPADVDPDTDGDLNQLTAAVMRRLQVALQEGVEARTPSRLAWAGARSTVATLLLVGFVIGLVRLYRIVSRLLERWTHERLERSSRSGWLVRASRVLDLVRGVLKLAATVVGLLATYTWAVYVLKQFPLTRPWGEALGGFLLVTFTHLGWNALQGLPGLFTVAVIFLATRFVARVIGLVFDAVAQGRLEVPGLSGAKVVPTRRLVMTMVWLFAVIVAYPYLPGSQSEAFKGVSLFLGLVVSLGSTGVVNQVMSGFVLTYAEALAPGDFVRIGDVEGTVTNLGFLSTKIKNRLREEITIPNAVVMGGTTVNYTRYAKEGVLARTVVTIGYDTPWRQVEALLLRAAAKTKDVRTDPAPVVLQTGLQDFYVEYTLLVAPAAPHLRPMVLADLHAHIQDAFNEFGVQIMSPHYRGDPQGAKVVARDHWFDAPAEAPKDDSKGAA
jgi:small-conductance mechanosensitive channel